MNKKTSKKVKQVASKAKSTPRTTSNQPISRAKEPVVSGPAMTEKIISEAAQAPNLSDKIAQTDQTDQTAAEIARIEELTMDQCTVIQLPPRPERPMDVTFGLTPDDLFDESSSEPRGTQMMKAIERDKKVELKEEIRTMILGFKNTMNAQLAALTDRIEEQLRPMVHTVAEVATAKVHFETQLSDFEDSLKSMLNLTDELEPVEIGNMFYRLKYETMDDEMADYDSTPRPRIAEDEDDVELLTEVAQNIEAAKA